MHVSAPIFLLVTAVLAAPAPNVVARRDAVLALGTRGLETSYYDQGDGFYRAVFNETTEAMDVSFVPVSELVDTSTDTTPNAKRDTGGLAKRATTCPNWWSSDVGSLDYANERLADNVNYRTFWNDDWAWFHHNGETSFLCSYWSDQTVLRQLVIDMHTVVSNVCGGNAAYGYDRRFQGGGAKNLVIGRTWRGDHFCDGKYHG